MLGYDTRFAHMECIHLLSSDQYTEKRLGYLSMMLLLDETEEVLPLIQHSLKKDLDDKNQFIQGLALTALASVASEEICRDLFPEVQKLLSHSAFVRKKAAVCAVRVIQKCPDLADAFIPDLKGLLKESNHAVLLNTLTLIHTILDADKILLQREENHESLKPKITELLPQLLTLFKNLLMSSFAKEHDIHGISDPFLQVKILQVFRRIGEDDSKASEAMNDLLAQATTNTESGKNAANSIIYECVNTITGIESEKGLRNLGIFQLSEFLSSKDNNLRYVSLNLFKKVVEKDQQSVLRHLPTIIECLKDHDVSIRKRAVDLLLKLVGTKNVKLIMQEFIEYLQRATDDEKQELTSKISLTIDTYAPSLEWKVDVYLRILLSSSHFVPIHMSNKLIALVTNCNDSTKEIITKKLFNALNDLLKTPQIIAKRTRLIQVAIWIIGEFSDKCSSINPQQIFDVIYKYLTFCESDLRIISYIVTSFLKLGVRYPQLSKRIQSLLEKYKSNSELELQLRSCEYSILLATNEVLKNKVVTDPKPPIEVVQVAPQPVIQSVREKIHKSSTETNSINILIDEEPNTTSTSNPTASNDLLMFFDDVQQKNPAPQTQSNGISKFENTGTPMSSTSFTNLEDFISDFTTQNSQQENRYITIAEHNNLKIEMEIIRPDEVYSPEKFTATIYFSNSNPLPLTNFVFQVKAPKYMTIKLYKASSDRIPGSSNRSVRQNIDMVNTLYGEKDIILKYQIKYQNNNAGEPIVIQGTTPKITT